MTEEVRILRDGIRYAMNAIDNISNDGEKAVHRNLREVLEHNLEQADWAAKQ